MNFNEFLCKPKNMTLEEYEQKLEEKHKVEAAMSRTMGRIYDERDSLAVLADEAGSERHERHLKELERLENRMLKLHEKYDKINQELK